MTHNTKSFFARVQQFFFGWRVQAEIYGKITQHIHGNDRGYAFRTREELAEAAQRAAAEFRGLVSQIEAEARALPKSYGDALRYIAYRDLGQRISMYRKHALNNMQPTTCDARLVATRA